MKNRTLNILKIKAEKFIDKITGRNQLLPFTYLSQSVWIKKNQKNQKN